MWISTLYIVITVVLAYTNAHITVIPTATGQTTPVAYQWTLPDGQKQLFFRPQDVLLHHGHPTVMARRYPCVHTTTAGIYRRQHYAMCIPQAQVMTRRMYRRHLGDEINRALIPGPGYGMGFGPYGGMAFDDMGAFGAFPGGPGYPELMFRRTTRGRRVIRRRLIGRRLRGLAVSTSPARHAMYDGHLRANHDVNDDDGDLYDVDINDYSGEQ